MPKYTDNQGGVWQVRLDPVLTAKVRDLHEIELVNLNADPLQKLRLNPELLVMVMQILCEREIDEKGLTDEDFGRLTDTTSMLEALREAIIDFFPSGQTTHVAEVLARYEEMATTTQKMAVGKMDAVIADPKLKTRLNQYAGEQIDAEIDRLLATNSRRGS